MPALARVSLVGYGLGGPFSASCTFLTEVFDPDAWRILAPASFVFCFFSIWILIRRQETQLQALLGLGYALLLVGIEATYAATEAAALAMTLTLGVIVLAAAMRLPQPAVLGLMVVTAIQIIVINPLSSPGTLSTVIVDGALTSICLVPSVTVLGYRRQLEHALEQITQIARTDPLTGLANRRGLADQIPFLVARAVRERRAVAVLAADLDHFKWINDEFGHAVGDEVLRDVAAVISAAVREHDVVARLGGEELCVVALLEDVGAVSELAERVRKVVERDVVRRPVTISVGGVELGPIAIAASDEHAVDLLWRVLDQADTLMYEAKASGRNAVRVVAV